jgi:Ca-activated chloride channel homolog
LINWNSGGSRKRLPLFYVLASFRGQRCIVTLNLEELLMKRAAISVVLIAFAFTATNFVAQSRPQTPDNINQKANKRPATPTETPKADLERTEIDPNIEVDPELVSIDTEVVTTSVKVTTRFGKVITGLTKDDFQVFDEKVEQEIAFFSDQQQPFTVALVLDMSYSSSFKIAEIQSAALEFVKQLREKDKIMVVSFNEQVHVLCEPTNDRAILQKAIYNTNIGSGTSLYDAVDLVINRKLSRVPGRKAVVLFTDGVDTTSRNSFANDNIRDAMELDALLFPIQYDTFGDVQRMKNQTVIVPPTQPSPIPTNNPFPQIPTGGIGTPGSQGTSAEDYKKADEYLNEMANRTNGRLYQAQSTLNLAQAFSKIAEELRSYYSLGFYPKEKGKPGERRSMKVKVKRDGVSAVARQNYVVRKSEKK